ncbi:MAG: diguanylate cyclase, partial [Kiritimatiellae bacterium]|nr:diguanylate cyclase [Kiritimatiellia bacterium]
MKIIPSAKRLLTVLFCALLLLPCAAPVFAEANAPREKLTVGVPVDRCPVFYQEDTGEIVGIGVDLMRAAAEAAGYDATFRAIG